MGDIIMYLVKWILSVLQGIFMLILLVLAKGWAVTPRELTGKPFIFSIWGVYTILHLLLYVWKEVHTLIECENMVG